MLSYIKKMSSLCESVLQKIEHTEAKLERATASGAKFDDPGIISLQNTLTSLQNTLNILLVQSTGKRLLLRLIISSGECVDALICFFSVFEFILYFHALLILCRFLLLMSYLWWIFLYRNFVFESRVG